MTNVLHIISDTNIGGAGRVLLNYLEFYDREKYTMAVALPRGSMLAPLIAALGVPMHELDYMRDKSYERAAVRALTRLIRELNPDIIHTHGALSGRIAGRRCKKTVIFMRHTAFAPNPRFTKGLGRFIFKTINERYSTRIDRKSVV